MNAKEISQEEHDAFLLKREKEQEEENEERINKMNILRDALNEYKNSFDFDCRFKNEYRVDDYVKGFFEQMAKMSNDIALLVYDIKQYNLRQAMKGNHQFDIKGKKL